MPIMFSNKLLYAPLRSSLRVSLLSPVSFRSVNSLMSKNVNSALFEFIQTCNYSSLQTNLPTKIRWLQSQSYLVIQSGTRQTSNCAEESQPEENMEPFTIYEGRLNGQIKGLKLISFTTTIMGFALMPTLARETATSSVAASVALFSMVGFFTFVTPLLIHLVAKRYVCEITFDPKTEVYVATTYNFFLQRKQTVFSIQDVVNPDVPGPFTSFLVKSKSSKEVPMFVVPETFTSKMHFQKLLGFDKPIDLHLSNSDNVEDTDNSKSSGIDETHNDVNSDKLKLNRRKSVQ